MLSPEGSVVVGALRGWTDAETPFRLDPVLTKEGKYFLLDESPEGAYPSRLVALGFDFEEAVAAGEAVGLARVYDYLPGHVLLAWREGESRYMSEYYFVHVMLKHRWRRCVLAADRILPMGSDGAVHELSAAACCRFHAGVAWALQALAPTDFRDRQLRRFPAELQELQVGELPPLLQRLAMEAYRNAQAAKREKIS